MLHVYWIRINSRPVLPSVHLASQPALSNPFKHRTSEEPSLNSFHLYYRGEEASRQFAVKNRHIKSRLFTLLNAMASSSDTSLSFQETEDASETPEDTTKIFLDDTKVLPYDPMKDGNWTSQWNKYCSKLQSKLIKNKVFKAFPPTEFMKAWDVELKFSSRRHVTGRESNGSNNDLDGYLVPTLVMLVQKKKEAAGWTTPEQDLDYCSATFKTMRKVLDECDGHQFFKLMMVDKGSYEKAVREAADQGRTLNGEAPLIDWPRNRRIRPSITLQTVPEEAGGEDG